MYNMRIRDDFKASSMAEPLDQILQAATGQPFKVYRVTLTLDFGDPGPLTGSITFQCVPDAELEKHYNDNLYQPKEN